MNAVRETGLRPCCSSSPAATGDANAAAKDAVSPAGVIARLLPPPGAGEGLADDEAPRESIRPGERRYLIKVEVEFCREMIGNFTSVCDRSEKEES